MAILKDWAWRNSGMTIPGAYHRFAGVQIDVLPVPSMSIKVAVYASQAARTAGNDFLEMVNVSVTAALVAAITGSAPFKAFVARLYTAAIKVDPQWAGGVDATDPSEV